MTLTKIISGGQTGTDQGALAAAKILRLQTGGWAPKGYWTEDGAKPELLGRKYGLRECEVRGYPPRTKRNVEEADATLLFGDASSPGSVLTKKLCRDHGKPLLWVPWYPAQGEVDDYYFGRFPQWLGECWVTTLNVAGNRESRQPGSFFAVRDFLLVSLRGRKAA